MAIFIDLLLLACRTSYPKTLPSHESLQIFSAWLRQKNWDSRVILTHIPHKKTHFYDFNVFTPFSYYYLLNESWNKSQKINILIRFCQHQIIFLTFYNTTSLLSLKQKGQLRFLTFWARFQSLFMLRFLIFLGRFIHQVWKLRFMLRFLTFSERSRWLCLLIFWISLMRFRRQLWKRRFLLIP